MVADVQCILQPGGHLSSACSTTLPLCWAGISGCVAVTEPVGPTIMCPLQLLCCKVGPYIQGDAMQDSVSVGQRLCEPCIMELTEALHMGKANPCLEYVWIRVETNNGTFGGTRGPVLPTSPQVTVLKVQYYWGPRVQCVIGNSTEATARSALVSGSAMLLGTRVASAPAPWSLH